MPGLRQQALHNTGALSLNIHGGEVVDALPLDASATCRQKICSMVRDMPHVQDFHAMLPPSSLRQALITMKSAIRCAVCVALLIQDARQMSVV